MSKLLTYQIKINIIIRGNTRTPKLSSLKEMDVLKLLRD